VLVVVVYLRVWSNRNRDWDWIFNYQRT